MTPLDWNRVAEVFGMVVERAPAERAAFLDQACGDDDALRGAVERMLAADASVEPGFLSGPGRDAMEAAVLRWAAPVERVGPWRIVREIGRGGMGQVYLAERADGQFEQTVAVKLLKRGMDSDAILARFFRERRILAALDHPNIARLLDGGMTEDGRPWVVMDFVDGKPITDFADERRLGVDERVALFRKVCAAVVHAHRNLVVHRDLKPSNILVSADGRPRLLDFGIAKLLAPYPDEASSPTLTTDDVRLMTPAYAAPEQIVGGPATTATDVYGLGAVLYELLAGRPPFAGQGDRRTLPPDTEPAPLPTAPLAASMDDGAADPYGIAAARGTDPATLRRHLSGDLDTIVRAAMRAEPERRYPSVEALDDDLRRHQERLPLRARPDTLGYRASRFVRRHPMGVVGASALVLVSVAFGLTATAQSRALEVERDRARQEAAAAAEVSDFLVGVFEAADPARPGRPDTIRASTLLERGADRVEAELGGQPGLQARLFSVIGDAYQNLGVSDRAATVLERVVAYERGRPDVDSTALAGTLHRLALAHANASRYAESEAALTEAIAIVERTDPGAVWVLLADLAHTRHGVGDVSSGNETLTRALDGFEAADVGDTPAERAALSRISGLLGFGIDPERAERTFRRLAQVEGTLSGLDNLRYAGVLAGWARARGRSGDLIGADSLGFRAAAIYRSVDSTSPDLARLQIERASLALRQGDYDAGIEAARESVALLTLHLGENDREVAIARMGLSNALAQGGRSDEAADEQGSVVDVLSASSADAALVPPARWRHASYLAAAGRTAEADAAFRRSLEEFAAAFPDDYLLTANARRDYGAFLVATDRPAAAEPLLQRALEVLVERWGVDSPQADLARISLGSALAGQGRRHEAETLLRPVLDRLAAARGEDDALTRRAREALDAVAEGSH